jgi:Kef-type K+ transport system membrane component KefB
MSPFDLSVLFFLQLVVILGACRLVSAGAARLGQPPAVGEMIAGVLLGPSFLALLWPQGQAALFPAASKPILFAGAQLGLALYMFVVGLELRIDLLRARWRTAIAISVSGIAAPFALGGVLAVWFWQDGRFFGPGVSLWAAVPYLGAAMAITAFPMLARIIVERKLTGTTVGALALAAGALDDAAAWGVLAGVLAIMAQDAWLAVRALGGGVLFVAVVFTLGRRVLAAMVRRAEADAGTLRASTGWVLMLLMLAAWWTDTIGLYAVFGAFLLGAAMPRGRLCDHLVERIEPLTAMVLLPLFFTYSGLNTRLDLVVGQGVWLALGAVLVAAIAGKAGACYLAARACGEPRREAAGIGMLMNARGLMELIILNIGLQHGLITPTLFSIMVVMAIVTTLMATPFFELAYRRGRPAGGAS